jgi:hypothetical protein
VTGLRVQTSLNNGTRWEDVQTTLPQNGGSGLKNGLGGPSVDPAGLDADYPGRHSLPPQLSVGGEPAAALVG